MTPSHSLFHPPIPHPPPPNALPPHPPLRPVGQDLRRRQHRARPRTARCAKAAKPTCRCRCYRSQRAGMSMLRRPPHLHPPLPPPPDPPPSPAHPHPPPPHPSLITPP